MQYSYQLFKYHNISIKIHIVYIITVIIAPIIFLLFFNILAALAILQFILLLSLSVFLHELGQVNFARRFKIYFKEIVLLPFSGIKIRETTPENTSDEIKIAFAGLTVYLVMFLLMLPIIYSLYGFDNVFRTHIYEFSPIIKFFQINTALLIFNAIPMYPMDGGRILRGYLSRKYNYLDATKLAKWVSYAFIIMLLIIGLFFGYILIVLAFFLYFSALSKGRLDQTIKVLEIPDSEAKVQVREEYLASRKRVFRVAKGIQTKAGKVLEESRFGFLLMIWIKFRDYFNIELTKGKLNWVRERLILILPKILRIRNLFKLWLKTRPVRKSIFFLLLAAICLTLVWTLFLEFMPLLDIGFFLSFGLGTFIIYYHTRSRKLMYFTIFGCFFWLMYLALEVFEPLLKLDYWGYLYYEGFRGCMVPLTGILFFAAIVNSNDFFKRANTHMPLPMFIIISVTFIIGVFVLFYEIYLLSAYENDLDTIRYILRYDIAYLIWFLASALILASLIYMLYIGSISHYGRITTLKLTAATIVILLLTSFLTRDLFILMLGRFSTRPEDINLTVGLHSRNITKLDSDEFDNFFHLEVTWSRVYSDDPNLADWSDSDWQMDYAMRKGIDIYFLITPRAPGWFVEAYPETVMRDQWNNTFYWIDEDPRKPSSNRIWDLSFNSDVVVNAKVNFTQEAIDRYQNYSCVKYISVQNEPTYPVDFNHNRIASYDPVTESSYRSWMAEKFRNDVKLFKNKTGISIKTWSDLDAPESTSDRLWEYWRDFREESLISFVERLTTGARQNTTKPVTVKIMSHYLARYQLLQTGLSKRVIEKFIQFSDVVSLDIYPLNTADLKHTLEFYKKMAENKPIIIAEFNLILGSNLPGSGAMFYYNLLVINRYAEAVIVFTGDNHYIYGINLYDHTPVHLGLKIFRVHREDGNIFSLYDELLWENLQSIPNYYVFYIFACTVLNIPIIPWPVLFLFMIPVPIAEKKRRWRVKKIIYLTILILMIIFSIASNLPV